MNWERCCRRQRVWHDALGERTAGGVLCIRPVDFQQQINGLAVCVQEALLLYPLSEQLFVFTNRRRTQVKLLYWEPNGFVL